MLSIGIIWNSAQNYENEIIKDLRDKVKVLDTFNFDLGDNYINFVYSIYQKENMEQWKINKKLSYMMLYPNANITVVFFEFDENRIVFHTMKKKEVFADLEECKMYIRKKYSILLPEYTFDIIFHATDNIIELKDCFKIIEEYLSKLNKSENLKLIKTLKQKI